MSSSENTSSIPDKLYFKIGEVAKIVGVKPFVLRYWETEFPEIAPAKTKTEQRFYKRKEVETILKIRDLLYHDKFTIDGARKKLKELKKEKGNLLEQKQIPLFVQEQGNPSKEVLNSVKTELERLLQIFQEEEE